MEFYIPEQFGKGFPGLGDEIQCFMAFLPALGHLGLFGSDIFGVFTENNVDSRYLKNLKTFNPVTALPKTV